MWRIISKEARELSASPRAMVILLLVSCAVLWLAARLPEQRGALRLHVEDAACAVAVPGVGVELRPCASPSAQHVRQALSDAPDVMVVGAERSGRDVWTLLNDNNLDAVLIWTPVTTGAGETTPGYERGGVWAAYADPRGRAEAARLDFVLRLLAVNDVINAQWRSSRDAAAASAESGDQIDAAASDPGAAELDVASGEATQAPRSDEHAEVRLPAVGPLVLTASATANGLGATPVVMVTRNGPAPSNSSWLAPGLVALISTFVAFLAGASSLAREGEQGTLHWLLAAARSSWLEVGVAKVIVATFLGAVTLLALLLFNWLSLDQAVNPDIAAILPSQLLSLLIAAMQGVAVSALVGRQDQAFLISGAYLILLSLFSGVFMPVAGSGGAAEFISWLLPTTFSQTGLVDWMQRDSAGLDSSVLISLGMLFVGTTLLWLISLRVLATRQ